MHWIVPQHPVLQKRDFNFLQKGKKSSIPSVIDQGHVFSTINGRSALMLALNAMDLQPGDEVLLPAYHCPVMVHPIVNMGCTPVFYRINKDTTVNLTDFQEKITKTTKAAILVNFFGFPSNIIEISTICKKSRIYLIEDCSHCFWGEVGNKPVGSYGDFAIASAWKFFSVYQGGFLIVHKNNTISKINQGRNSIFFEFKAMINTLEEGYDSADNTFFSSLLDLKNIFWNLFKNKHGDEKILEKSSGFFDPYELSNVLDTYSINKAPFILAIILQFSNNERIIKNRRNNFYSLSEMLKEFPHIIVPIKENIDEKTVPYVFPVITPDADNFSRHLRKKGINILRFGHSLSQGTKKECDVTNFYSKRCVQIPIHQSLNSNQLEKIRKTIRAF